MRLILSLACASLASSCAFYSYPEKQLVAREGEKVLHYQLVSVEAQSVKLKGEIGKGFPVQIGKRFSAGNNQRLELLSTDPKQKQATFNYSSLEWHGGLVLPPF